MKSKYLFVGIDSAIYVCYNGGGALARSSLAEDSYAEGDPADG